MTNEPRFWAVAFIGPPGSGKDTQADLLAEELGLLHVQTSRLIEAKFNQPGLTDPVLLEEKRKWTNGELADRDFVNQIIAEQVDAAQNEHLGLVFSGSPRDLAEVGFLAPKLEAIYSKENFRIVNLQVSDAVCVDRNTHRRICELHRHPIPNLPEYKDLKTCPKDNSLIITRALDTEETTKRRLDIYRAETTPVLDWLKKRGYNIVEINGEQSIEDVHRDILNRLW